MFFKALHVYPYQAIYSRFHRTCHATNLGWAAHVVHHSSPDFNLGTALRQGTGEASFSWVFNLPLALLGVPLHLFALHKGANTVYQFFTHTEMIDKLWWPLELVLNTPSHHRVHHARNYGRRNFAGMLIIWDRMLGTFVEESPKRTCVYGLDARQRPLGTFNPLCHQLQHLACTLRLALAKGKPVRACFTRRYGPGMVRPSVTDAEPARLEEEVSVAGPKPRKASTAPNNGPWDARPLGFGDYYAAAHFFGVVLPVSLYVLGGTRHLSAAGVAAGVLWSALAMATLGEVLNGTLGGLRWELLRMALHIAALKFAIWRGLLPPGRGPAAAAWCAGAVASLSALLLVGRLVLATKAQAAQKKGLKKEA
ncbi:hypothetical protein N2152v2_004737 [Parachlorella kessleri]